MTRYMHKSNSNQINTPMNQQVAKLIHGQTNTHVNLYACMRGCMYVCCMDGCLSVCLSVCMYMQMAVEACISEDSVFWVGEFRGFGFQGFGLLVVAGARIVHSRDGYD